MQDLVSGLLPGQRQQFAGLAGSGDALALAQLAVQASPLLVITATAADAQRLTREIAFFDPNLRIHLLPDWETLPYDGFSPHSDLVSERLETLYLLSQQAFDVVIAAANTALQRLAPAEYLAARTFFFKRGQKLLLDDLRRQLALAGYSHVMQVVSPGEFCIRGGIIDLFPTGSAVPYRIDLDDDTIDAIKSFDADSQRTIYPVPEVRLLPAREFPMDEEGRTRFRQSFRTRFDGDPSRVSLYKDVSNGIAPAGIEYYLPLFHTRTATLADYLPPNATVCLHGEIEAAARDFWTDTEARHQMLDGNLLHPVLKPAELFMRADELFGAIKGYTRVEIETPSPSQGEGGDGGQGSTTRQHHTLTPALPLAGGGSVEAAPTAQQDMAPTAPLPLLAVERRAQDPLHRLREFTANFPGRLLLLADSAGRRETMLEFLQTNNLKAVNVSGYADFLSGDAKLALAVGPLAGGFILTHDALACITENELYAAHARTGAGNRERQASPKTNDAVLRDLSEIKFGDPVVHEQHGVGRYQGLTDLDLGEGKTEFLLLVYARNDKLYVPVSQLHLISRYTGGPSESAPLHALGSGDWDRAKRKAARQVRDTAAELLLLYAKRAAREGHAFGLEEHDYVAFADEFPFDETVDQAAAIGAVLKDLQSGKPMDRLICGDVGFGKTEVALRAAFVAAMEGRQVAVLVPTTLLAEQHYNTFSDRFADWAPKVAEMSRFRSGKEMNATLKGLAEGTVDIVIGTHRLLSPDVKFKNLGLVIIDEEHRFGVRQKERFKALRAEVDVLTLTATPIPRTLAMAMEGLREFSVITTAPQRRLAIKTFVAKHAKGLIREALLRELKRGGQVYFLHNDIESIGQIAETIEKLVPEARVRIAHGQMRERELEAVMRDFYQARFNVLVCTTIIETGIDVPAANTIVINRADRFGLAQLHQLRGRVGRSHHQAYAYLLLPEEGEISADARKRLDAIQLMEDLGSGFFLAMHDLEIRGAGEVLGDDQSGEMQEIGFGLYCQMLEAAVKSLKAGREPDLDAPLTVATEINLHAPALLPSDYCADVHERLVLYKRLANCDNEDALILMHEELVDRFGTLPPAAKTLLECHRLRVAGAALGVTRIDASDGALQLQFVKNPPIDGAKVLAYLKRTPKAKLTGPEKLLVSVEAPDAAARAQAIRKVFKELAA